MRNNQCTYPIPTIVYQVPATHRWKCRDVQHSPWGKSLWEIAPAKNPPSRAMVPFANHLRCRWRNWLAATWWLGLYSLAMTNIAVENHHVQRILTTISNVQWQCWITREYLGIFAWLGVSHTLTGPTPWTLHTPQSKKDGWHRKCMSQSPKVACTNKNIPWKPIEKPTTI